MYTLLVTKGPDAGVSYPIKTGKVSVGRAPDMGLILTDPSVRPRHFLVTFEEGGWKAITYEPDASILIDRRWEHPVTKERGARIFVGDTQLLLFAGPVDLQTALSVSEGLDIDPETLRDDALTTVGNEAFQFRHDMKGKAARVNDRSKYRPSNPPPGGQPQQPQRPSQPQAPMNPQMPRGVMNTGGSQMHAVPIAATIEQGRRAPAPGMPGMPGQSPPPQRNAWGETPGAIPQNRALAKGQMISLTDTAIGAMPSSSRDLWVLYEKDGPFASELRILATRLEELKSTFGYKSFLITSVGDGEGKTVISSNLALVMSEDSERKIALVDANFRSPRAADLFNLDKSRGILSAISGERPLSECVARVLGRNLIVLNAGGEHNNPSAVLSDPRFKTLLNELSQAIDFMIIDTPSAVPFADVPLLTQHVDAVFMVVAADVTNRSKLDKALDTIGRNRVVGTIFVNAPDKKKKK